MQILYEDNHLLVAVKPPGLATMGLGDGEETFLTLAKDYIRQKYHKPGCVYLGVVSRLDVPVSGVVVFARTSKAAARLNEQFRDRTVTKTYLALVEGTIEPATAVCIDRIREDERHRKVWITRDLIGKESKLSYRRLEQLTACSLVEIHLETGRKHQIRVQLASRGFPVLGDRKYGARSEFPGGIALHAWKLALCHPIGNKPMEFTAPIPVGWKKFGVVEQKT